MPFKYPSMAERLIANSVVSQRFFCDGEPCWEWVGACCVNRSGQHYGKMATRFKSGPRKGQLRTELAHRVSIKTFTNRVLTQRMVGMHKCNVSWCVNPAHLAGGTQKRNVRDCVAQGRHRNGKQ